MLTLTTLREHVGEGPSDEVLDRLLIAANQVIDERIGPADETISELLRPSGSLVRLSRRALSITSIIEGSTLLDEADYVLRQGGRYVMRLADAKPSSWRAFVDVAYQPFHNDAERDRVALALIQLDLNYEPGLVGRTISSWSEQYAQGDRTYSIERESILSSLRQPAAGVW
jgi:hypothetical protein